METKIHRFLQLKYIDVFSNFQSRDIIRMFLLILLSLLLLSLFFVGDAQMLKC